MTNPTTDSSASRLKRQLGSRHLNMIAIGGSIGTGLFLGSGKVIATAGPAGALLAYALIGLMIYFLMTSLGEMASYFPTSGAFASYGDRFVDPSFGFALGWNYWYNWAITVAFELVAVQFIMQFFMEKVGWSVPSYVWSALFLGIVFLLNALSVKKFGESEFLFSLVKVIAIILFIICGIAMIIGIMLSDPQQLVSNWQHGDAPFVGGFAAMFSVMMIAGFSFQGTEMVGVAAGESKNPKTTIPTAIRKVFWRILLFYIVSILIIGLLIPYDDPRLLQAAETENISLSPFTLLFERAGFAFAAAVMNTVILTAILSAGNSGMYVSTRILYDMARNGKAPRMFKKVNRRGVPINALLATTAVAALCFSTTFFGNRAVFDWLLNTSGMCGFIVWLGIAISHYRFRKAYVLQGKDLNDLPYLAKWFPYGAVFAFALCLIVMLGQNYQAFIVGQIDWLGIISTYLTIPLFLSIWLGYKWRYKTKVVPYMQMDVRPYEQFQKNDEL